MAVYGMVDNEYGASEGEMCASPEPRTPRSRLPQQDESQGVPATAAIRTSTQTAISTTARVSRSAGDVTEAALETEPLQVEMPPNAKLASQIVPSRRFMHDKRRNTTSS